MSDFLPVIRSSRLFHGVSREDVGSLLSCLSASEAEYGKNAFILQPGDQVSALGMVLSGAVHVVKEDFWGNRNLLAKYGPGELFAETYACVQNMPLEVGVLAAERTQVLFLDMRRVLTPCSSACAFHSRLIRNLLAVLATRNLELNEKLRHMARRSTREKLLSYLSAESQRQGSASFLLPFNRQQLADYLSVDRSAMSKEMSRMRAEGLLSYHRGHIELKKKSY